MSKPHKFPLILGMNRAQITNALYEKHQDFIKTLEALSSQEFQLAPEGKWSASEQLDHIYRSVKPLNKAFAMPLAVLKLKFGLAKKPSRSYEVLVSDYQEALLEKKDFAIPSDFTPKNHENASRATRLMKLEKLVKKLGNHMKRLSEKELDTYVLPHPLLGKLTLREMLYFTCYHVMHHQQQIIPNIKAHKNA